MSATFPASDPISATTAKALSGRMELSSFSMISRFFASRSATTTRAPAAWNRRANAAPIPFAAPVTTVVLPSKFIIETLWHQSRKKCTRGAEVHTCWVAPTVRCEYRAEPRNRAIRSIPRGAPHDRYSRHSDYRGACRHRQSTRRNVAP